MTAHELRRLRAQKIAEAKTIFQTAAAASRDLSAEERPKFDGLMAEADSLEARAKQVERFDVLEAELAGVGGRQAPPLPHEDPANTRRGQHVYSMLKAMRQRMYAAEGKGQLDGLELEVHNELAKRKNPNSPVRGVLVPWSLSVDPQAARRGRKAFGLTPEARALDTTAGVGSIPTILESTMIDILRARMVTQQMGAKVLADMQGLFAIPRQNAAASFFWVAEGGAPTGSNQTADQVAFTPKTGGAFTDYTRRFMEQTNQDAEQFVRNDLAAIVARGVETAGLNGSGASNQPRGILQIAAIPTVAVGTNGGAPTWDVVVNLESQVAISNADMGSLGYVTDAAVRGKLKRTAKIGATFPIYLWDTQSNDTPLNSNPVGITNLLPANLTKGTGTNLHAAIYGNWADLIYAFWSGIDILVDPYTGSSSGTVRVVALQDVDLNVRHPESFAKCVDIDTT
jgi:HK97 family phage major capsid protein